MSLMGSVSRGLRAGWGQLRSRASIRGLCWNTGDDGMDWERRQRRCAAAQTITPMRVAYGRAVREKYSRPQSRVHLGMPSPHLEPQINYILGKPRLFSCATCMHKGRGNRGTGTGRGHRSAEAAGSPEGPTALPEGPTAAQSNDEKTPEDSVEVQRLKDRIVYLEEELSGVTGAFNSVTARLEEFRLRTQNYIADAKIFGITAICRDLLKFYDALTSMKLQLAEKDAESQSTKEVVACLEDLETRLDNVFKKHDVSKIDAMGLPYNMYEHTIKGYVPRRGLPPSTVVEVVQDGYRLQGRVIRHSLVYVSMETRIKDSDLPTD